MTVPIYPMVVDISKKIQVTHLARGILAAMYLHQEDAVPAVGAEEVEISVMAAKRWRPCSEYCDTMRERLNP